MFFNALLEEKTVPESHVDLLHDLYKELRKAPGMADWNFGLLVALAFVDPQSGAPNPQRTIEEYFNKAKETLTDNPELERLGDAIQNRSFFSRQAYMEVGSGQAKILKSKQIN